MTTNKTVLSIAPAVAAALLLGGCTGAIVGNLFVLMVSIGIFFGTLGLGRTSAPRQPGGDRPASESRS